MQCSYMKQDGSQCWANAMSGSEYCWFHAPEVDYDRRSASQRGGQVKRTGLYAELAPIPLKKIDDIPGFLMDTIQQLRGGFISGKIAVTLGYLCSKLMRSFETAELNASIKRIEKKLIKLQSDVRYKKSQPEADHPKVENVKDEKQSVNVQI